MSVAKLTRDFIDTFEPAKLFTYEDLPVSNRSAAAIELSRLYKKGIIKKVSKGRYYKPKKTTFAELEPDSSEKLKYYTDSDERSYETGINAFRKLGLTTQVANSITIATDKTYKKVILDNLIIKFVPKRKDVPKKYVTLLQMLDALKDIKKIPDSSSDDVILTIKEMIGKVDRQKQEKLSEYVLEYPPRVRAIVGAIFKEIGLWEEAYKIKQTINSLSKFRLNISKDTLKYKKEWGII